MFELCISNFFVTWILGWLLTLRVEQTAYIFQKPYRFITIQNQIDWCKWRMTRIIILL